MSVTWQMVNLIEKNFVPKVEDVYQYLNEKGRDLLIRLRVVESAWRDRLER